MKSPIVSSLKLAAIFLVFGVAWIISSDLISRQLTRDDLEMYSIIQHSKGLLFMVLAALLIYFGSKKILNEMEAAQEKWVNKKLQEEKERHRLELAEAVLKAQEKERKKLGEELHDNINQLLGVVKLYVQHAMVNKAMQDELLEKCSEYIRQVIEEIRLLSRSLLPPALHENGLLTSLDQLVNVMREVNAIGIELKNEGLADEGLPEPVQLMLYRIVQEQLNNVLKHAKANHVLIHLKQQKTDVQLTITDNGKGFDPRTNIPGMGLMNIRSRLQQVNGRMQLTSSPDKGCSLNVSFHL
ncbi:hypothetical protein HHL16_09210 [Pseudoflavitalea sp. G-6-1-2]|uniref:sensor histidine kinase n=1 Tax=Pseudoflavitalea sp. G-6-1-2 TaxID=2728841 RepID=UPI00146ED237|nr:ATP-binding protein [Pseudoflavitalea sp. G-6-1-2]NML21050.1 hypothetical protein [Pseudoflavitalea sp. G-6-1-2]